MLKLSLLSEICKFRFAINSMENLLSYKVNVLVQRRVRQLWDWVSFVKTDNTFTMKIWNNSILISYFKVRIEYITDTSIFILFNTFISPFHSFPQVLQSIITFKRYKSSNLCCYLKLNVENIWSINILRYYTDTTWNETYHFGNIRLISLVVL